MITIALLIAVSIYFYLIKNQPRQNHLLPFHDRNRDFYIDKCIIKMETNDKLKEIDIKNCTCKTDLLAYDGTRYLVLLGSKKYDFICDRIRYLISVKNGATYIISHNYATIKVDSQFITTRKNNGSS